MALGVAGIAFAICFDVVRFQVEFGAELGKGKTTLITSSLRNNSSAIY